MQAIVKVTTCNFLQRTNEPALQQHLAKPATKSSPQVCAILICEPFCVGRDLQTHHSYGRADAEQQSQSLQPEGPTLPKEVTLLSLAAIELKAISKSKTNIKRKADRFMTREENYDICTKTEYELNMNEHIDLDTIPFFEMSAQAGSTLSPWEEMDDAPASSAQDQEPGAHLAASGVMENRRPSSEPNNSLSGCTGGETISTDAYADSFISSSCLHGLPQLDQTGGELYVGYRRDRACLAIFGVAEAVKQVTSMLSCGSTSFQDGSCFSAAPFYIAETTDENDGCIIVDVTECMSIKVSVVVDAAGNPVLARLEGESAKFTLSDAFRGRLLQANKATGKKRTGCIIMPYQMEAIHVVVCNIKQYERLKDKLLSR